MAEGTNGSGQGMNRRRFLTVLGVTGGGAAALAGCSSDQTDKLIPYLIPPENQIPGIATWYATTCRECSAGCGIHARVREGRVVKVEGNPDHPVNQGKLCARGQASLQGLYNPDRVRGPMARAQDGSFESISWDDAVQRIAQRLGSASGSGIRFVTGLEGDTFGQLVSEWLSALGAPAALTYEPLGYEALRSASRTVFGIDAAPHYDFATAQYVLSFGTDFLVTFRSPVRQAREFAESHGLTDGKMGRYVHVEPRMSMSAMSADEWIAPKPGTEALMALAMAHVVLAERLGRAPADAGRLGSLLDGYAPAAVAERCDVPAETIERIAREFAAQPSVAVAGGSSAQHGAADVTAAAAHLLNYVTGNVGRTVRFPEGQAAPGTYADLVQLVADMNAGGVAVLFVHDANPAFAAPSGLGFGAAMGNVAFKVSFARFMDETAQLADLVLPDHDPLEQWNDSQPEPGVNALQQPVMAPVFDTRQTGDVLLQVAAKAGGKLAGQFSDATYKDYLQRAWHGVQRQVGDRGSFDEFWMAALERGGVWRDASTRTPRLASSAMSVDVSTWSPADESVALVAYPSPALYDGRGANRPWLQELPDPVSKITWSTWVEIHPETAAKLDIEDGIIVEVASAAGTIEVPAFVYPGIRPDTVAVPLGQGHRAFGRYAEGRGANVFDLLSADATPSGGIGHYVGVRLRNTGRHEYLATTAGKARQMGRGIARAVTLAEFTAGQFGEEPVDHAAPLPGRVDTVLDERQESVDREWHRGNYKEDEPRWAMAIDLSRCTGCSACVTACYSENNIPTVGPDLIRNGREMSWMRIERYFEGGEDGAPLEARVLPMLCQQCGSAPCEPVCPVFAAYHTPDGLNGQIYNRCVGTRYCSNNCPYKVRYFNFFDYQKKGDPYFAFPEPLNWLLNPDVTVRAKGVMEKCTFCVQRIRDKQNHAKLENRKLADGEILTACQQTCPSNAIVFGDLRDPNSKVRKLSDQQSGYHVLEDLNTRPAITYLQKVRNVVEA